MGSQPTVLIVTQPFDVTADYVVDELNQRGVPVFRCNPGDFPRSLSLTAELGEGWTGSLLLSGHELSLTDIGCAWYRRPTVFEFDVALSAQERRWATTEARLGFGGVLAALPRWLNHPADIARAEYKPMQLACARGVGLAVPDTLITNDPTEARRFAQEHGDEIIYKPFSSSGVVERGEYRLVYTSHDVPDSVRIRVLSLLDILMLRFAAIDFVVTPDNEWVFLEANPNGQWAWLQDATCLPIAAAVADALTKEI